MENDHNCECSICAERYAQFSAKENLQEMVAQVRADIVEAVARAIIAVNAKQMMLDWEKLTPDEQQFEIDNGWDMWMEEAQAAIDAMHASAQGSPDRTLLKQAEIIVSNLRDAEKYMLKNVAPDEKPDEDDQPPFTLYGEAADMIERLAARSRAQSEHVKWTT